MTLLSDLIERVAREHPTRCLLSDGDEAVSAAEFLDRVRRVAGGLAAAGIGAGDRVGFWLPNCSAYLIAHFACAQLGAVTVSINTRFGISELEDILERSRCSALLWWPGFTRADFRSLLRLVVESKRHCLEILLAVADPLKDASIDEVWCGLPQLSYQMLAQHEPAVERHDDEVAGCLTFTTSGTTSRPKFVLHTQHSLARHAAEVAAAFGWDAPGTVVLQMLPLCGTFGHAQALAAIGAGAELVSVSSFEADEALRLMVGRQVTHAMGVDDMFARLLEAGLCAKRAPAFRFGGFAAFNPALRELAVHAADKGIELRGLWGMSELQALVACRMAETDPKSRACAGGQLISSSARVRVRHPESGELLAVGDTGELEITAPSQMAGYLDDEAATAQSVTDDGFIRTGDLGHLDADGGFTYLARIGDALRLGGFLVDPSEIESIVEQHDDVAKAQAVGVDTASGTRAFVFVIAAREAVNLDDLKVFCVQRMARYKQPVGIEVIDEFPFTASANGEKIQKTALRQRAEAVLSASATTQS